MITQVQSDAIVNVLKQKREQFDAIKTPATPALTGDSIVSPTVEPKKVIKNYTVEQVMRWTNCSYATVARLCAKGIFNAEKLRNVETGRLCWFIHNPKQDCIDIISKNVTKHGWTKKAKKSNRVVISRNSKVAKQPKFPILNEFLAWKAIPDEKRAILEKLGKMTVEDLNLLVELVS